MTSKTSIVNIILCEHDKMNWILEDILNVSKIMLRNILIGKQLKCIKIFPKLQKCKIRNWAFATNFDFLILISLQSNLVNLRYFKLWILLVDILSLKFWRLNPFGCTDIRIRKFEFGSKTQFLCSKHDSRLLFVQLDRHFYRHPLPAQLMNIWFFIKIITIFTDIF